MTAKMFAILFLGNATSVAAGLLLGRAIYTLAGGM